MLNTGKESYDNISIPEDMLLKAIGRGLNKHKIQQRNKRLRHFAVSAACFVFLLFGCANIPILYTYASEIPIVKTFVQAMRIGSGGIRMDDVTVDISADSDSAVISFLSDGEAIKNVLSYSAEYFYAPSRLQMTFDGMNEKMYSVLEDTLRDMKAVKDIYRIHSEQEDAVSFVIVLNGLYNYELMEFTDPGSLALDFYQDAYYTEEEKHPGETVYFLRTGALNYETTLKELLVQFMDEKPAQIKNQEGEYILVIGEYTSQEEAECAYDDFIKKYGSDFKVCIDSAEAEAVPQ